MGKVLKGMYGYYFPYTIDGKNKGLTIHDWVHRDLYAPGYLTDEHIEQMLFNDKIFVLDIPDKGQIEVKIIPYEGKRGPTKILKLTWLDEMDDEKLIAVNAEKIVKSYYVASKKRFDYSKPMEIVEALPLHRQWATFARSTTINGKMYGTVKVYTKFKKNYKEVYYYCEVDPETDTCELVDESKLEEARRIEKAAAEAEALKREIKDKKRQAAIDRLYKWLDSFTDGVHISIEDTNTVKELEPLIVNATITDTNGFVQGLLASYSYYDNLPSRISTFKKNVERTYSHFVDDAVYEDPVVEERLKINLINSLKIFHDFLEIKMLRTVLYKEYQDVGLASLVEDINIDSVLSTFDLGNFRSIQKILNKIPSEKEAVKYIILNMYKDNTNAADLKEKLLTMLKIYYDFFDMPEKDRKSIAKFIAVHKLSDYYEKISKFDDVLETLIDNSKDPKLIKPLINGIIGTPKVSIINADKTFYYELHANLRNNIIMYKPLQILDELRELIPLFNSSSDVAILTNIILNADESFTFQFYTFDSEGMDGRRILNLTKIYNRCHDDHRIGFSFDNIEDSNENE